VDELERIKRKRKLRQSYTNNSNQKVIKKSSKTFKFVTKALIVIILTLIIMIFMKINKGFKEEFYKEVFEKNFSFTTINKWYQKYLGSFMPFDGLTNTKPVFSEKLKYTKVNKYLDGAKLTVTNSYLVPAVQSGLVVFIGQKDGYGNTVTIQGVDGVDVWYGNIENVSVGLYDYVELGKLIGNTKGNSLYLVYKKNGAALNYEDYL
jgi:stage IV sporulation protein FA